MSRKPLPAHPSPQKFLIHALDLRLPSVACLRLPLAVEFGDAIADGRGQIMSLQRSKGLDAFREIGSRRVSVQVESVKQFGVNVTGRKCRTLVQSAADEKFDHRSQAFFAFSAVHARFGNGPACAHIEQRQYGRPIGHETDLFQASQSDAVVLDAKVCAAIIRINQRVRTPRLEISQKVRRREEQIAHAPGEQVAKTEQCRRVILTGQKSLIDEYAVDVSSQQMKLNVCYLGDLSQRAEIAFPEGEPLRSGCIVAVIDGVHAEDMQTVAD